MRKIINPFETTHRCFGCSRANEHGLHMEFREDGDRILCDWEPQSRFTAMKPFCTAEYRPP